MVWNRAKSHHFPEINRRVTEIPPIGKPAIHAPEPNSGACPWHLRHLKCTTNGTAHQTGGKNSMRKTTGVLIALFSAATLLLGSLLPASACAADKISIRISAAMSLKNALTALKETYENKTPNIELQINYASSGLLQKQIEQGAPVDIFLSAGKKQMDELEAKGFLIPGTRSNLLGNALVLIVAKEKKSQIKSFADLVDKAQSISIGQPETVPAGKYAKETLINLNLWKKLEKRIMFAKDVRQVLAYVESGNVDAGMVYQTDTVILKSGAVVAAAPAGSHSPIVYPMAEIKDSKNRTEIGKFMSFLKTAEAAKVFEKYKFIPLGSQH
jgi:molybdate transport system substrate-binding protein